MPTIDEQIAKAEAAVAHMQMLVATNKADTRDIPRLHLKIAGARELLVRLRAQDPDPEAIQRQQQIDAAWRDHRNTNTHAAVSRGEAQAE